MHSCASGYLGGVCEGVAGGVLVLGALGGVCVVLGVGGCLVCGAECVLLCADAGGCVVEIDGAGGRLDCDAGAGGD